MTTPDPDPQNTTGLEPGGGTPPGETPPGEASTVAAPSQTPKERSPAFGRVAVAVVIGIGVLTAVFFVAHLAGILG
ncbi:DUF6480 family protein [Litorihabitans aurantiacus]|uniref:Uncharacterized protein n=1 Tax=Litorihabitans aurantiacus TaxID=1930061 RepID=A0AA38CSH5_9MICO|nr:DUF6480 family protein [Litorihabitans aurantiacus]GMA31524.1 hypothetical protein GCM10025875_15160 [Litorihabitans aurantiacus]